MLFYDNEFFRYDKLIDILKIIFSLPVMFIHIDQKNSWIKYF